MLSSNPVSGSVLVVDGDPVLLKTLERTLRDQGRKVRTARTFAEGLVLAKDFLPEVAVIGLFVDNEFASDWIPDLKRAAPDTAILIFTGHPSIELALEAMRTGAAGLLMKPASRDELLGAIEETARRGPCAA